MKSSCSVFHCIKARRALPGLLFCLQKAFDTRIVFSYIS
ncbi:hypothetical protein [Klebsiella phage SAKp15]|nr:hypothetical protein [Klebsiella phage SAKp02]